MFADRMFPPVVSRPVHFAAVLVVVALLAVSCLRYPNRTADNRADNRAGNADAETVAMETPRDLDVEQTWTGQYNIGMRLSGEAAAPAPQVIRDNDAFTAFISGIPKKVVQPTADPPDTSDPLVANRPEINFETHMVIALVRGDNMYTKAEVRGVRVEAGTVIVDAWYPDSTRDSQMQNADGVGTYTAVLVEAAAGELQVDIKWEGGRSLAIEKVYRGRYPVGTPDNQKQAPAPRTIRNADEYDAFVSQIPKEQIQPTQTRPASNDPLLKKPDIDFSKQMLVVVFRGDNMYSTLEVMRIRSDGDTIRVWARYEDPTEGDRMVNQLGIGTYVAVLCDRADGDKLEVQQVGE